ncbi:glycoside hydrolase family 35 protein [Moniliophthora roreri]|nr:glycoside hydrolase family 35 protein [Moniliophthora roreri]
MMTRIHLSLPASEHTKRCLMGRSIQFCYQQYPSMPYFGS